MSAADGSTGSRCSQLQLGISVWKTRGTSSYSSRALLGMYKAVKNLSLRNDFSTERKWKETKPICPDSWMVSAGLPTLVFSMETVMPAGWLQWGLQGFKDNTWSQSLCDDHEANNRINRHHLSLGQPTQQAKFLSDTLFSSLWYSQSWQRCRQVEKLIQDSAILEYIAIY